MYKLKRLKKDKALTTIHPPRIAYWPGYSPKTNQTKIGAKTDSSKTSNETSEELMKRGPSVSKQEEAPMIAPCIKIRLHLFPSSSKNTSKRKSNRQSRQRQLSSRIVLDSQNTNLTNGQSSAETVHYYREY